MGYTRQHHSDVKQERQPLSIFSWYDYDLPMCDRLSAIRSAGFQATSLWWGDGHCRGAELGELTAMARDQGLHVENVHVPYELCNDLWSRDAARRGTCVDQHIRWLEDCSRHAIPRMVMHLTVIADLPAPDAICLESMDRIVTTAEQLGVIVAVENTRRRDYVDFVLERIPSRHLGFCYDSSHARLNADQGTDLLRHWGHRLVAVHLSDNDGKEDRHWLPGNGVIDWRKLAAAFPHDTYGGCIHLEVVPNEAEKAALSPEAFVGKAYEKAVWVEEMLRSARQDGGQSVE
jgi:sugar phosphate isomerase/epimerase